MTMSISINLTVFFENPFWVGVFERKENGLLETSRIVFGPEPKDYEVYTFVLANFYKLKFSKPIVVYERQVNKINPKRLQREIKKLQSTNGMSTKSQDALRLQREENKFKKKNACKEQKELEKKIQYARKLEKKKQKKRGH